MLACGLKLLPMCPWLGGVFRMSEFRMSEFRMSEFRLNPSGGSEETRRPGSKAFLPQRHKVHEGKRRSEEQQRFAITFS